MRSLLLGSVALLGLAAQASAATCVSGANLGQWLGSGFSCTVGDKTFSNFTYAPSSGGGAVPIAASAITVTTIDNGPAGIGFQFSAPWTVSGNGELDSLIGFTVTVTPPAGGAEIHDAELAQSGTGFFGLGTASVAENLSNNVNLLTFDSANETVLGASDVFSPTGSVDVTKDISTNANSGGATISSVTDLFSETGLTVKVPEPASLGILGLGLIGLAAFVRRRN